MTTSRPSDSQSGSFSRDRLIDQTTLKLLGDIKDLGVDSFRKRNTPAADSFDNPFLVADIKPDPKALLKPKPESVEALLPVVEKATDAKMSVNDRVAALQAALLKPGENNDDLIKAIIQSTANCPVKSPDDPRLPLLARIGSTHQDPRVEQAAAITLLRTKQPEAYRAGLWMLADVANRGGEQEKTECAKVLETKASFSPAEAKEIDLVKKDVLGRTNGVLSTINDSGDGIAKQDRLKDEAKVKEKIKAAEDAIADPKLPGRFKVQALADAWMAGDLADPTKTLAPMTRKLAFESKDEQVKAAAIFLLLCSKGVIDRDEAAKLLKEVGNLAENASNEQVKAEAKYVLSLAKKK